MSNRGNPYFRYVVSDIFIPPRIPRLDRQTPTFPRPGWRQVSATAILLLNQPGREGDFHFDKIMSVNIGFNSCIQMLEMFHSVFNLVDDLGHAVVTSTSPSLKQVCHIIKIAAGKQTRHALLQPWEIHLM
jgi:hypothetical protein